MAEERDPAVRIVDYDLAYLFVPFPDSPEHHFFGKPPEAAAHASLTRLQKSCDGSSQIPVRKSP